MIDPTCVEGVLRLRVGDEYFFVSKVGVVSTGPFSPWKVTTYVWKHKGRRRDVFVLPYKLDVVLSIFPLLILKDRTI